MILKPHERRDSDFYLDVYLRVVKQAPKELLQGAFGIALAEALYRHGSTGKFLIVHDYSSEVVRVTPEGPVIFSRSLRDRTLSGEILRFGTHTDAYRLLGLSFIADRRFPIMPFEGPKLIELQEKDPLGLEEAVRERLRSLLKYLGIDFLIADRRLVERLEREEFEYQQAEKLVQELGLELLDKLEDSD